MVRILETHPKFITPVNGYCAETWADILDNPVVGIIQFGIVLPFQKHKIGIIPSATSVAVSHAQATLNMSALLRSLKAMQ